MSFRPATVVGSLIITGVVATGAGCPAPYYDDVIGVEGVATDPGSLAGTFALQSQAMDQANTVLGPVDTGGITWSLVIRTARADDDNLYDETIEVCGSEEQGAFSREGLAAPPVELLFCSG